MTRIAAYLEGLSTIALFSLYSMVRQELKRRGFGNPVGDRAEWLVAKCLGLRSSKPSTKGFDLIDARQGGTESRGSSRIQVKARLVTYDDEPVQFSDFRYLKENLFDRFVGVAFRREDMRVCGAFVIPHHIVLREAYPRRKQMGLVWQFRLNERIKSLPGVLDITERIKRIEAEEISEYLQSGERLSRIRLERKLRRGHAGTTLEKAASIGIGQSGGAQVIGRQEKGPANIRRQSLEEKARRRRRKING